MERLSKEEYRQSREFDLRAASGTGFLLWLMFLASTASPEELYPDEPNLSEISVKGELDFQGGLGGWDDYQNSNLYPETSWDGDKWQYWEGYGYFRTSAESEDSQSETEPTLIY